MPPPRVSSIRLPAAARIAALLVACGAAMSLAQPADAPPPEQPQPAAGTAPAPDAPATTRPADAADQTTVLGFKNVTVEQVIPFLVEATGKVVLPQADVLSRRITIINDQPIPRKRAYELVVLALQQAGVAVTSKGDTLTLRALEEIDRQDVEHIDAATTVLTRTDEGSIAEKVFALRYGSAANLSEQIKATLPPFAKDKMFVDADSNQIVVTGNIGLLQRIERLINSLDQPAAASLSTETFLLRYADAEQIATNINELYGTSTTGARTGQQQQNPLANIFGGGRQGQQQRQGGGQGQRQGQGSGRSGAIEDAQTSQNLRVTANTTQNSVTVLAEKQVIEQIRKQIREVWDRPLPEEIVAPRVFQLHNSDPIKVEEILNSMFGTGAATQAAGGGQQQQGAAASRQPEGVGRLLGQFQFKAVPEAGRIMVLARSPENLAAIEKVIEELDQPLTAGLPEIVELKHANAEELAEQLNALLSQEGTLAQITKSESGLATSETSTSPFSTANQGGQNQTTGTTGQTNQQNQGTTPGTTTFWWQRARPPTATAGTSNLISKIRIVPVWRQNALMVMAPPEYQSSLVSIIADLDRPGRQVLLSAVIAEISLEDELGLGIRWSSFPITPVNTDNAFAIGASSTPVGTQTFTGQKNDLLPGLFDTSVLNIGADLNVVIQALSQKNKVNILSEPRIFTSDNQQAEFFSGQDIPFITDSQTTDNGNLTQSFDYRAVGIALRVRPRITTNRDIDLSINLELSSIVPGQTLFGGFIVDRRETTTHLIVKDGQTVVLSGILRSVDTETKRKVPLLGDIPLAGELFKSTEKGQSKAEIVAFVTPYVVGRPEEADPLNQPDREHLEHLREQIGVPDERARARVAAAPEPPAPAPEPPKNIPPPTSGHWYE